MPFYSFLTSQIYEKFILSNNELMNFQLGSNSELETHEKRNLLQVKEYKCKCNIYNYFKLQDKFLQGIILTDQSSAMKVQRPDVSQKQQLQSEYCVLHMIMNTGSYNSYQLIFVLAIYLSRVVP
ncbi:Hypothetical_protein [Hexamita inflata]|uniref:Hypothetical_protein n=1 Tax=Hexamita inflata TaxID=28002 RepID=A0AA86U0H1_9EUKA|nr:Hypothetical protein HINF_LOCUS23131 [Hexamita inflata]